MKLCVPPPKKREEKEAVHPCFQWQGCVQIGWRWLSFQTKSQGLWGWGWVGGWGSQYKSQPEEAKTHNYIHPWKTRGEGEAHFISLVLWEAKEKKNQTSLNQKE